MKRYPWASVIALLTAALVASTDGGALAAGDTAAVRPAAAPEAGGEGSAAEYTADGRLKFPAHYREWIYLSSGIDMRYTEEGGNPTHSMFDNVFADPRAYREFLRTGEWPNGTVLILENRGAAEKGSINRRGHYQTGDVMGLEAHVKDTKRFQGGWAFVAFRGRKSGSVIAQTADCYSCHRAHGAVDTTFVQFYPTLLEIAKRKGTLVPEH